MAHALSMLLLGLAALGIGLIAVQITYAVRHVRKTAPEPTRFPGISILKPLCGVDDRLVENLEAFALLDYPNYEVLLGVETPRDEAFAVAWRIAARFPDRMRVIVQRDAPGLNPKVNQLITLARYARHDLTVISDSNVVPPERYLHEIAAHFENPHVGIVTHPIAGVGESTWGSLLDNVHLSVSIAPGMIAANGIAGEPLVVGKSMAFRREDLRAIGGFHALKDVLAEDFVMGRRIATSGKRIVVAHRPIVNVSCARTLRSFYDRYVRWAVLQRTTVGLTTYTVSLVLHPLPLACAAVMLAPERFALNAALAIVALKLALETYGLNAVRRGAFPWRSVLALPLKDATLVAAWGAGLVRTHVCWRGRRLRVVAGTRLLPLTPDESAQLTPERNGA